MNFININSDTFWVLQSGIVFFIMTMIFLAGPFQRERNELMYGILGFLAGMTWFHIFLALGMYFENGLLNVIAAFGAMTGSAFLLQFPLTSFANQQLRKNIFYGALVSAWFITILLLLFAHDPKTPMIVGSIYMIIVSGAIGGVYFVWKGLTFKQSGYKIKCIGGGCSIIFCCLFTHLIVLTIGMTVLAKFFMILTPISVVLAVVLGHELEKRQPPIESINTTK